MNRDKHATGYHKRISFFNILLGLFIDKQKFMGAAEGKWKPFENFYVNGTAYGGIIGTPDALMKYLQALMQTNSRLLSPHYKQMLFTENHLNSNNKTGMCLAWFSGQLNGLQYYAHAGGGGWYYYEIKIYPALNVGSVIIFNRTGMRDERFLNKVDQYALAAMLNN